MINEKDWLYDHGTISGHRDAFGITHLSWTVGKGFVVYTSHGSTIDEAIMKMFNNIKMMLYDKCN